MITPPPEWRAELRQSGVYIVPPEGPDCGFIQYAETNKPLQCVPDITERLRPHLGYAVRSIGVIERLTTVEGEYAALVTIDGSLGGEPIEHTLGIVFNDDSYSMTSGLALRTDQFARFRATVRELVCNDTFMFSVRRRRFFHDPVPGWHGFFVGSMHVKWLPMDYPRGCAVLTVYPALPVLEGEPEFAAAFVDQEADRLGCAPLTRTGIATAASGLSGTWYHAVLDHGADLVLDMVVLEDRRFIYPISLESMTVQRHDYLPVLRRLVDSVNPIPGADAPSAQTCAEIVAHWLD